jgi:hypothetical protein
MPTSEGGRIPKLTRIKYGGICVGVCICLNLIGCSEAPSPTPIFTMRLAEYGYTNTRSGNLSSDYSSLVFVSDDLVLVAINERQTTEEIEPLLTDHPASKFLLFDIKKKILLKSADLPAQKQSGALQHAGGSSSLLWNRLGVQLCGLDFTCELAIPSPGPVSPSPQGTRIAVGGNARTDQILLDSTLTKVAQFQWMNPAVVPGDGVELLRYKGHRFFVKEGGGPERPISIQEAIPNELYMPLSRFLNPSTIAINETDDNILVTNLDAKPQYRVKVSDSLRRIDIVNCPCGTRFAVRELKFSVWNSITNPFDIEHRRAYDVQELRVFDVSSGKMLFVLNDDPRPYVNHIPVPVLSPTGKYLASIRNGALQIYEIP